MGALSSRRGPRPGCPRGLVPLRRVWRPERTSIFMKDQGIQSTICSPVAVGTEQELANNKSVIYQCRLHRPSGPRRLLVRSTELLRPRRHRRPPRGRPGPRLRRRTAGCRTPRAGCAVAVLRAVPERKTTKKRPQLDLPPPVDCTQAEEVARLEALGARRADVGHTGAEPWLVMADSEGNEFCVLRSLASGEAP